MCVCVCVCVCVHYINTVWPVFVLFLKAECVLSLFRKPSVCFIFDERQCVFEPLGVFLA